MGNLLSRLLGRAAYEVTTGGFFANGRGFYFHKPVMNEIHEHHGLDVLEKMSKHIILGAEYDSSYRDDPPRCHPDTRTQFLEQLQARLHDPNSTTRIIWLVGPAGIGKSAIMQSLAEIVCPLPTLRCATLFLSRPNQRDDPKKVFTTLAYGFAVADLEYRRYMAENFIADPLYLNKSMDEQFKRIFILPFASGRVSFGSRRWVVFLDGLDECGGGNEQQSRIVDLIRESIRHHPKTIPFIWIVASRPEPHLRTSFRLVEEETTRFWKLDIPIDSEEALQNVELYLRTKFTGIRRNYSDIVPEAWPSENDFLVLTKSSSGLFVFASTLVDYVGKENPVDRLKHVVSLIARSIGNHQDSYNELKKNPFYTLDMLYSTIMSGVPLDSLLTTKNILGFYLFGDALRYERFLGTGLNRDPFIHVCNVLGIERHTAYAALRNLHSVLTIPSPDEAINKPISFLHASFSDFLKDRSRSQSYCIDLNQELTNIWGCFANIIRFDSLERYQRGIPLSWEPQTTATSNIRRLIQIQAKRVSVLVLIEYCHDPSCQHTGMEYRILPDAATILQVFEKLGSGLFTHDEVNKDEGGIGPFCHWLSNHAPVTIRQQMVLEEYGLMQLRERDLDCIFTGLQKQKWALYHINKPEHAFKCLSREFNLENLSVDEWNHKKQRALNKRIGWEKRDDQLDWRFLTNLLTLHKNFGIDRGNVKVIIIQLKPSELYAIIGPLHIPISEPEDKAKFLEYLALPYVE